MPVSADYVAFILELLAPIGLVTSKRFFGGIGLYLDGLQFAFIANDALYFKIDIETRPTFDTEDSGPFTYDSKSGPRTIDGYWSAPERLFDEADEMVVFARAAVGVARRAAARKKPARATPTKPRKKRPTRR